MMLFITVEDKPVFSCNSYILFTLRHYPQQN